MHLHSAAVPSVLHVLVLAATTKKTTTTSGASSLLFILVLLALGAYLFLRPQRKRMRAQQQAQQDVRVGDEVITASGIVGRVQAMRDDRVDIEVAPGTTITVVRRMLGTRAPSQSFDEPPGPNGSAPPAEAGLSVGLREEGSSSADGGDGAAASGGSS